MKTPGILALSLCACTPVIEETDPPASPDASEPVPAVAPAIPREREAGGLGGLGLEPVDLRAELDTEFACAGEVQHVARYHQANLQLRKDGTFELHVSDVSDDGGESLWMLGDWDVEPKALLLRPESGLQRKWTGDAHKHVHGEPSGYSLDEESGVYTHERRLPVTVENGRITAIRIDEIGTSVFPRHGDEAKPCDPTARNP